VDPLINKINGRTKRLKTSNSLTRNYIYKYDSLFEEKLLHNKLKIPKRTSRLVLNIM
jgi:hypothetical protein